MSHVSNIESPSEVELGAWLRIFLSLAMVRDITFTAKEERDRFTAREDMKTHSSGMRSVLTGSGQESKKAPYWLMHAYAHWERAWDTASNLTESQMDEHFPTGLNFRVYLGHWISAVGIPQLGMDKDEMAAFLQLTAAVPGLHPLMQKGYSSYNIHRSADKKRPNA